MKMSGGGGDGTKIEVTVGQSGQITVILNT
jgi:hypothetical protein